MGRSFFKTRNSRTFNFHVVFLMVFQFRGLRLASRIAKVSFLVKYFHIKLMLIGISCVHILLNKKVHLYVNEKWRGHVHNLKLTANQKYSPLQMTTLKFLQNGWQDGEQEKGNLQTLRNLHLSLQSSWFDGNASTFNLKYMWLRCVLNFMPNKHSQGYFTGADTFLHVDPFLQTNFMTPHVFLSAL